MNKAEKAIKLVEIREAYIVQMERQMRDNQMQGIAHVIRQVMDECFNEIGKVLND